MCNERAKRKRLVRSGTFMAQWFIRWTLESETRVRAPHGPLQYALSHVYAVLILGLHSANARRRYKNNTVFHWLDPNLGSALFT